MLNGFLRSRDLPDDGVLHDRLCMLHHVETREQLYQQIATHAIVLGDEDVRHLKNKTSKRRWQRFIPFLKNRQASAEVLLEQEVQAKESQAAQQTSGVGRSLRNILSLDKKKPLLLNEETISRYLICDHCHPIPGDDVLAFQTEDGYITIHKRQCSLANRLKAVEGNSILAAVWDTHKVLYFPAVLHIEGIDRVGVLHQMTGILSQQMNLNISNLNVQTNNGIFTADIIMEVHDLQDLQDIIRDLKKIQEIDKVIRVS